MIFWFSVLTSNWRSCRRSVHARMHFKDSKWPVRICSDLRISASLVPVGCWRLSEFQSKFLALLLELGWIRGLSSFTVTFMHSISWCLVVRSRWLANVMNTGAVDYWAQDRACGANAFDERVHVSVWLAIIFKCLNLRCLGFSFNTD